MASLGLHLVVVVLVVGFWPSVPEAPVVRMRLVAPHAATGSGTTAPSRWWKGVQADPVPDQEPGAPEWQPPSVSSPRVVPTPTVPVNLEELLAGVAAPPPESAPVLGWSIQGASGDGYALPPLPPPQLAPRQGARWSLTLEVPGIGGFATVEGLDSGHPALDQWLEAYLRTVVFPPSLDGEDYRLRWNLTLDNGRPE